MDRRLAVIAGVGVDVLPAAPFARLEPEVAELVRLAVVRGRKAR